MTDLANGPEGYPRSRYRWRILALLFAATTINYLDRSILGVLAPTLQYKVFHWTDADFASINIAFKTAYALGLLIMGAVIDRFGTKVGYAVSIALWSTFGALHAAIQPAFGLVGFVLARFGLGLGEAGNFPAAIKTVATWFPARERALATGIFNAGSNVGAILAPIAIPLVVQPDGRHWQFAFLLTAGFSVLWIIAWLRLYGEPGTHPRVSPAERAWITDTPDATAAGSAPARPVSLREILRLRATWGVSLLRFADAAWWFYLFWGGKFLFDQFGLDIRALAVPLITIYLAADVGSVGGGWLSSRLIAGGMGPVRARKATMLGCALLILPVAAVTRLGTRFETGDRFFAQLAAQGVIIPAEQQARLDGLRGQSFATARDFTGALAAAAPTLSADASAQARAIAAARTDNRYWIAVLLLSLAAAGHQAWAANMFSLISDYSPRRAVASVTGFSGMVGALAGMTADFLLGRALTGSGPGAYFFAFVCAGSVYLVVLGGFHLLLRGRPVGIVNP